MCIQYTYIYIYIYVYIYIYILAGVLYINYIALAIDPFLGPCYYILL